MLATFSVLHRLDLGNFQVCSTVTFCPCTISILPFVTIWEVVENHTSVWSFGRTSNGLPRSCVNLVQCKLTYSRQKNEATFFCNPNRFRIVRFCVQQRPEGINTLCDYWTRPVVPFFDNPSSFARPVSCRSAKHSDWTPVMLLLQIMSLCQNVLR